jgi:hypothetical protein
MGDVDFRFHFAGPPEAFAVAARLGLAQDKMTGLTGGGA